MAQRVAVHNQFLLDLRAYSVVIFVLLVVALALLAEYVQYVRVADSPFLAGRHGRYFAQEEVYSRHYAMIHLISYLKLSLVEVGV